MKKVLLILLPLCCFVLIGCNTNDTTKDEDVYYKDPASLRLVNGTYMPVENKSLSNVLLNDRIDDEIGLNCFSIEDETDAYELAESFVKIDNPSFFQEPVEYGIAYFKKYDAYKVYFVPASAGLDGGINLIIKSNGEILSYWYDG